MSGDRLALAEVDCPTCDGKGWWHDHCDKCYATGEWCGCGGEQRRCETCVGSGRVAVVPASLARLDCGNILGSKNCCPEPDQGGEAGGWGVQSSGGGVPPVGGGAK